MRTVRSWGGKSYQWGAMVTGFGHANGVSVEWKWTKIESKNIRGTEI